jgi:hypothetical protein
MLDICPKRPANVKGTHYRPRKEARSRRKTVALLQTTARLMHRLRTNAATGDVADGTETEVVALAERYEEPP